MCDTRLAVSCTTLSPDFCFNGPKVQLN